MVIICFVCFPCPANYCYLFSSQPIFLPGTPGLQGMGYFTGGMYLRICSGTANHQIGSKKHPRLTSAVIKQLYLNNVFLQIPAYIVRICRNFLLFVDLHLILSPLKKLSARSPKVSTKQFLGGLLTFSYKDRVGINCRFIYHNWKRFPWEHNLTTLLKLVHVNSLGGSLSI